uniref:Uncharacterized protein n=1 Tax=Pseudo-nitzschia australis TaxID=44445 RepID=A0A7S4EIL2_9STRA|mmetsp:Transcript_18125/g.39509  ORF Transcript_18125/g.39509 Transcript_18125/m.39509 type:complete len:343 (+) Transcript_18125:175-1203(+)|eukprot:CAMPEP_0168177948 /NCGR_PEP_ID=MMETSP0139_2-20121125/8791_1 /TAXON_ID=44445 /ORGANISM="Pseudo-nitzschia australis, Strain 10249 10 AB" /LENGTH=342 /DNA_ID=CAMNT_0008097163 /DNA_START=129 /DNA_END=1157 /DNA_ORIENTATION=-
MSPPSNENQNDRNENSNSSWFASWFEGSDVRNDIHEQLNDFDERKKRYEEDLQERQRFLYQSPFSSFFPPASDNSDINSSSNNSNNGWEECFGSGHDHRRRHSNSRTHEYSDDNTNSGTSDRDRNNNNHNDNIDEIHREIQNMFETAFAGSGILSPEENDNSNSKLGGWNRSGRMPFTTSSSSTSVVSNSNGSSYRMQQDSRTGARIDVQLPRKSSSNSGSGNSSTIDDITLEVLKERPCVIQWGNNKGNNDEGDKPSARRQRQHQQLNKQMVELGDAIDCSKLSASISEARNTLTVEAPIRRRDDRSRNGEEGESLSLARMQRRQQQQQQSPRSIPVSKTD